MNNNYATMLDALQARREKKTSAGTLVSNYLRQVQIREPQIHAFNAVYAQDALKQAESLDKGKEDLPLSGIPYAVKANFFQAGRETTACSRSLAGFIPSEDAPVVARLKALGAICLGQTNMDELAMGSSTMTSFYDKTYNPWDIKRTPGGSSGGSAAAVAAGEVLFALGSDTGGSIRQPAAFCGAVGFKPTNGLISNQGVIPLAPSFDQVGLLTRSVADCACLLQLLSAGLSHYSDYRLKLNKGAAGLSLAVPREFLALDIKEPVLADFHSSVLALEKAGACVEEISLPSVIHALAAYHVLAPVEIAALPAWLKEHGALDSPDKLGSEAKRRIILGRYFAQTEKGKTYLRAALSMRQSIISAFGDVFAKYDAVLTPVTRDVAFRYDTPPDDVVEMYKNDLLLAPANLAGLPAISVPTGMIDGLPVAVQIMAAPYREDILLRTARALEIVSDIANLTATL